MHSLKPSGDNIAQEFLRLMGKRDLVKSASIEENDSEEEAQRFVSELDELAENNRNTDSADIGMSFAKDLEDAMGGQANAAEDHALDDDDLLESMIIDTADPDDESDSGTSDIDAAADALEAMDLALDHTASESRVLDGLSKIAGSLRAKGEAFAADVVEATALSIRGDLRKDAGRRATVVSGLKKLASEFYSSQDTLAGDMVAVTIKKLGGNPFGDGDPFEGMDKESDEWDEAAQDKSKFAKDKAAIPATLKAAKVEVATETDGFKEMDIWLSYGITMTASHYVFELQSGEKVKMAKS
jgi:hypothetical protein